MVITTLARLTKKKKKKKEELEIKPETKPAPAPISAPKPEQEMMVKTKGIPRAEQKIVRIRDGKRFEFTPKEWDAIIRTQMGKGSDMPLTPEMKEEVKTPEQRRLEKIELEKQQLITEGKPERVELDPQRIWAEKMPLLGGFATAGRAMGKKVKKALGIPLLREREFDPSTFRTAELAAIAKKEADNVLTWNQILGGWVEALPTGDSVLGVSFARTLEKPSENAEEVFSNIRKIKRQITNIETNVKMGYLPVSVATEQLNDMEINIIKLEARLKSYINNSPSLKFNSDRVNTMETDILTVKEKWFQSKLNVLEGKIQDPDEMALFIKKQELRLNDDEWEV